MRRLLIVAAVAIAAGGCGGAKTRKGAEPVFPVTGVVTYQGQPVAGADLCFFNAEKNISAFGKTDDKGVYKLTTYSANDGAIAGTHAVTIMKLTFPINRIPVPEVTSKNYQPPAFGESTQVDPPKSELPPKYADRANSGLNATVKSSGTNTIDFPLQ